MKDHEILTPSQSSIVPPYTQYVRIVLGLKTTLLIYLKILMNKSQSVSPLLLISNIIKYLLLLTTVFKNGVPIG